MEDAVSLHVSSLSTGISKRGTLEEPNQDDIIVDVQNLFISNSMKMDGENRGSGSPVVIKPTSSGRLCCTRDYPLPYLMDEKNIALYERIVAVSKMSLASYEKNHPGESYEFVCLKDVKSRPILGVTYFIIFLAKNLGADGGPLVTFRARVNKLMSSIKVQECELI